MQPLITEGGQLNGSDQIRHLHRADGSSVEPPEVLMWLAEAKRLFAEAEERLEAGNVLPALSSLAAVPPLHRMLVDRCSELLITERAEPTESDLPSGLYL
jgi:hypothetical protein